MIKIKVSDSSMCRLNCFIIQIFVDFNWWYCLLCHMFNNWLKNKLKLKLLIILFLLLLFLEKRDLSLLLSCLFWTDVMCLFSHHVSVRWMSASEIYPQILELLLAIVLCVLQSGGLLCPPADLDTSIYSVTNLFSVSSHPACTRIFFIKSQTHLNIKDLVSLHE